MRGAKAILPTAIVLVVLGVWEVVVQAGAVDALILPAPSQIAASLWKDRGLLGPDLAVVELRERALAALGVA